MRAVVSCVRSIMMADLCVSVVNGGIQEVCRSPVRSVTCVRVRYSAKWPV